MGVLKLKVVEKMKLKAKINSRYLDLILSGEKVNEFREFESIEFTDESGRSAEFNINSVHMIDSSASLADRIRNIYSDVPWTGKHIFRIGLGDKIK